MNIWSRIKAKRQEPPDIQIFSSLSPLECHKKLTGKDKPRRLGYPFLKMLRLHGTMSDTTINVRLQTFHVSGSVDACESGTRISLWVSDSRGRGDQIRDETITAAIAAIPIIGYSIWQGSDPLSFLFIPGVYLVIRLYKELRLTWPQYPATPDELAQMLAGHLQGVVFESIGVGPQNRSQPHVGAQAEAQ